MAALGEMTVTLTFEGRDELERLGTVFHNKVMSFQHLHDQLIASANETANLMKQLQAEFEAAIAIGVEASK